MRLFICVDMEGIAGVVSTEQLGEKGYEYEMARRWMTAEVGAVCEAALGQGTDEIIVADSHGKGQNLILEDLPGGVEVVRSWPRPLAMMQGIDEGNFDGAVLLGQHGGAHETGCNLAHTYFPMIRELRLNDKPVTESEVNAATAGHFGVPIVMVSGKDRYIMGITAILGDVEAVCTGYAHGLLSARTVSPIRSRHMLAEGISKALTRLEDFQPYSIVYPIRVEVDFQNSMLTEIMTYVPTIERVAPCTISYLARDMIEVSRFMGFLYGMIYKPWQM